VSERVAALAERVAARLAAIPGVVAVVLGGSRASGAPEPDADLDLGLYYRAAAPPALRELRALAQELADAGTATDVTDFGAWGPWVNGGAWLVIEGVRVDWLYRELGRVAAVIDDCTAGRVSCDYYLGHPHGFHNHYYAAEVATCRPLADAEGVLAALKGRVARYPRALRDALVAKYLYDAAFMLDLARKPAARGDVFHVAGCLFRVAAALVQVLFAESERWLTNEKRALARTDDFARRPERFAARVAAILASPGASPDALAASVASMGALVEETRALC
jgi:predicted nucleotidyltransferase